LDRPVYLFGGLFNRAGTDAENSIKRAKAD
jgi:hypothetical protein